MKPGIEVLLRNIDPMSPEQRQARRERLALESMARYGRGSVALQHGAVLFDDEKRLKAQRIAARLREHRTQ